MPPKFFITHSWKDLEFAQRLCDDLRKHGLDGFFDAYSIQPGDDIASRVAKGLEECDVYMPLLSRAAVESPWCELEINTAINLSMEHERKGKPRIIPVVIEPCKLPTLLRGRLHINFHGRYNDALKELLTKGFEVTPAPKLPVAVSPLPKIETLPRRIINPKDSREMILIPAGEFVMGSDEREDEKPPHRVHLDALYIARYPVTNAEYKKFVNETGYAPPSYWTGREIPQGKENHPVVSVNWDDVAAYTQWVGGRLPTEAEWEKAASWDDARKEKRRYPWGNEFDASKCNSSESGIGDTTPVGKYSPQGDSPYGVGDMAGNVWEWCADWYDRGYYRNSLSRNPHGSASGQYRVVRGGSWGSSRNLVRCACRHGDLPDLRHRNIGFRVVVAPISPASGL